MIKSIVLIALSLAATTSFAFELTFRPSEVRLISSNRNQVKFNSFEHDRVSSSHKFCTSYTNSYNDVSDIASLMNEVLDEAKILEAEGREVEVVFYPFKAHNKGCSANSRTTAVFSFFKIRLRSIEGISEITYPTEIVD